MNVGDEPKAMVISPLCGFEQNKWGAFLGPMAQAIAWRAFDALT
jgi:hypothetical protein